MKISELFKSTIETCDIHAERLKMALHLSAHLLPMQPASINNLTENEFSSLDMMTFRFSKELLSFWKALQSKIV